MTRLFRALRVLAALFVLNLSLSVALSQAALPLASKGKPVMTDHITGLPTSLARRVGARRRIERARSKPAVLPSGLWSRTRLLSFAVPSRVSEPYAVSAAPPDHPPA